MNERRKVIFSGIQPSGSLMLGNYLGAIKNFVELQDFYDCYFCVVDMHAITVRQDPAALRRRTLEVLAMYIASGIAPEKNTLFIQSHVPQHAELAWVLSCFTMYGELTRMTQFKDKSQLHADNINAGLFSYPVLMAADILLYDSDLVPVGEDQKQHLELARNIADRVGATFPGLLKKPEPYIPKEGARIMSLQDPSSKMSKSDPNENAKISIMDEPDAIMKKFKRSVTDSEAVVAHRPGKDGINNLMTIYGAITGKSMQQIEDEFAGRGYGDFKAAVGECVVETLRPIRERTSELLQNEYVLEKIYTEGAQRACEAASVTLSRVYKEIGFVRRGKMRDPL